MNLQQWLDYQLSIHPKEIDLGLSRVHILAERLGISQFSGKIITVAGTNGKGSTVALLDQLLRSAGLSTGTYTSPHFISYTERITLSGTPIAEDELCQHFEAIEAARGERSLTFFEYGTLAAVRACATHEVDVMILEIGLGGRLDACNAWDTDVAIVTSIGIDHVDWLGDDIEVIGKEKAGVFRANKPAIVGRAMPASVLEYAQEIGARLQQLGVDFSYTQQKDTWDFFGISDFKGLCFPALQGAFQLDNASCAIQAVLALYPELSHAQVNDAMQSVFLVGRLQRARYQGVDVLLDVTHNPDAAMTLASFLGTEQKKTIAVFAMMEDKDIAQVVEIMKPHIEEWVVFDLPVERAASKTVLTKILHEAGVLVKTCDNCKQAMAVAVIGADENTQVLVFGSFFTVASFLEVEKTQ